MQCGACVLIIQDIDAWSMLMTRCTHNSRRFARGRALSRPAAAAEVAEVDTDAAERESSSLL